MSGIDRFPGATLAPLVIFRCLDVCSQAHRCLGVSIGSPSDRPSSDFPARVVQCVGPVEKDIEVDTEGSEWNRWHPGPFSGRKKVGEMCAGVKLLVLLELNCGAERPLQKIQSLLVHFAWFPRGSFKARCIIIKPYFLITSSNMEKRSSSRLAYFQEVCEKLGINRFRCSISISNLGRSFKGLLSISIFPLSCQAAVEADDRSFPSRTNSLNPGGFDLA